MPQMLSQQKQSVPSTTRLPVHRVLSSVRSHTTCVVRKCPADVLSPARRNLLYFFPPAVVTSSQAGKPRVPATGIRTALSLERAKVKTQKHNRPDSDDPRAHLEVGDAFALDLHADLHVLVHVRREDLEPEEARRAGCSPNILKIQKYTKTYLKRY